MDHTHESMPPRTRNRGGSVNLLRNQLSNIQKTLKRERDRDRPKLAPIAEKDQEEEGRIVYTNSWNITINTNQRPKSRGEARNVVSVFGRNVISMFRTDPQVLFNFEDPNGSYESHVGYLSANGAIEYSGSGIHAHLLVTIHHIADDPKVLMDREGIQAYLNARLTSITPGVYLHISHVHNNAQTAMRYNFKFAKGALLSLREDLEFESNPVPKVRLTVADNVAREWPEVIQSEI